MTTINMATINNININDTNIKLNCLTGYIGTSMTGLITVKNSTFEYINNLDNTNNLYSKFYEINRNKC